MIAHDVPLPGGGERLVTDARIAARTAEGSDRRAASTVLADVYALVQPDAVRPHAASR